MRRPVVIFLGAVLLPGLVLGGFALQSIRHQEAILTFQRQRLLEGVAQRLAQAAANRLDEHHRDFSLRVESLLAREDPDALARVFDERIREHWPMAQLGFAVSLAGGLFSPAILGRPEARQFLVQNDDFLCNRSSVEVFAVTPKGRISLSELDSKTKDVALPDALANVANRRFVQLIGDAQEGVLARFLNDQLAVWVWYRTPRHPELVYGAQVSLDSLKTNLATLLRSTPVGVPGIAIGLLDERGQPLAVAPESPRPVNWSQPLVSVPIGASLPHWRVAAAVMEPGAALSESRRLQGTLGVVVILLVAALAVGGWVVATDARRQLELARRKSDFVSNVSHELRTPLTSIQLFADLLAEDRVQDPEKRRKHLGIIRTEARRLHRLIGHVLDFARHERGEGKLYCEAVELNNLVSEVLPAFALQFEVEGIRNVEIATHEGSAFGPSTRVAGVDRATVQEAVWVNADRDALAQLLNNLLSNAVKYAATGGEVTVRVFAEGSMAILEVLDRGPGVPPGCARRVFEEFFRADDALSSGVPGAGLGLALARRIARAHAGELAYRPRDGGGACFRLELPRREIPATTHE